MTYVTERKGAITTHMAKKPSIYGDVLVSTGSWNRKKRAVVAQSTLKRAR
jgi:hypothetical protein